jgi:hypothetical protein
VARPKASLEAINAIMENPGLVLVTGIFTMAGGAATVVGTMFGQADRSQWR